MPGSRPASSNRRVLICMYMYVASSALQLHVYVYDDHVLYARVTMLGGPVGTHTGHTQSGFNSLGLAGWRVLVYGRTGCAAHGQVWKNIQAGGNHTSFATGYNRIHRENGGLVKSTTASRTWPIVTLK